MTKPDLLCVFTAAAIRDGRPVGSAGGGRCARVRRQRHRLPVRMAKTATVLDRPARAAPANATATTTIFLLFYYDTSNTATATGGIGGSGCLGGCYRLVSQAALAARLTRQRPPSINSGAAAADATSFGGTGGEGGAGEGRDFPWVPGGTGGKASSNAAASTATARSASATANSTGGHGGIGREVSRRGRR